MMPFCLVAAGVKQQRRAWRDADIAYRKEHRAGGLTVAVDAKALARRVVLLDHGLELHKRGWRCSRPCPCAATRRSHRRRPAAPRSHRRRKKMQARAARGPIAANCARRSPKSVGANLISLENVMLPGRLAQIKRQARGAGYDLSAVARPVLRSSTCPPKLEERRRKSEGGRAKEEAVIRPTRCLPVSCRGVNPCQRKSRLEVRASYRAFPMKHSTQRAR